MARLPYVKSYKDRHGRLRHYYRRAGHTPVPLPGEVGSPEFLAAYTAATEKAKPPVGASKVKVGTINALCVAYYASGDWADLKEATRGNRRAILEGVRAKHGEKRVAHLEKRHVQAWMDERKDTPHAANNLLKTLRGLLAFAVDRSWITQDPTAGIKKRRAKGGGFHSWTEDEIAQFEAFWPVGTRQRLALDLLLYTSSRRSTVYQLGPQHLRRTPRGLRIVYKPSKTADTTGLSFDLPVHPRLKASIAPAGCSGQLAFLTGVQGRPFKSEASFGNWFADQCDGAGLPAQCRAHGLRKASLRRLAEAGASAKEMQAVSTHATLAELERYVRAADAARLADGAFERLRNAELSNPGEGLDNSGAK